MPSPTLHHFNRELFARDLTEAMRATGHTRHSLGRLLGMHGPMIYRFARGECAPTADGLVVLLQWMEKPLRRYQLTPPVPVRVRIIGRPR